MINRESNSALNIHLSAYTTSTCFLHSSTCLHIFFTKHPTVSTFHPLNIHLSPHTLHITSSCLPHSTSTCLLHSTPTCLQISSTQHPPVSKSHSLNIHLSPPLNIHLSPNLIHSTSTCLQISFTQHPPVSKSHSLKIHLSPNLIHSTSTCLLHSTSTCLQISSTQHPPVLQISFTQHPPVSTCPPLTFDGVSSSHVLRVPPEAVHEETVDQTPVFWCLHLMEGAKGQRSLAYKSNCNVGFQSTEVKVKSNRPRAQRHKG